MGIINKLRPYDKFILGIVPGILIPLLIFLYLAKLHYPYSNSLLLIVHKMYCNQMLGNILIMSAIPNMFLVFVFYKLEMFLFASGIVLGAMPFLILSLFLM
jgi:hypothetical protein